jgi:hypothetical protein
MSIVRYAAVLEAQPEGGFTATFPGIPEAITEGDTREEALFHTIFSKQFMRPTAACMPAQHQSQNQQDKLPAPQSSR